MLSFEANLASAVKSTLELRPGMFPLCSRSLYFSSVVQAIQQTVSLYSIALQVEMSGSPTRLRLFHKKPDMARAPRLQTLTASADAYCAKGHASLSFWSWFCFFFFVFWKVPVRVVQLFQRMRLEIVY